MRPDLRPAAGFTLLDTLVTMAILAVLMGMAVPVMTDITRSMRLGQGAREVERELQTARFKAVTTNRTMRVRFNCPVADQYRTVELIGTPGAPVAADSANDRCGSGYPYPSNPDLASPNHDGAVQRLPQTITFNSVRTIEFRPDGTAHIDTGAGNPWPDLASGGTSIVVQQIHGGVATTRSVAVNSLGKIQIQ